MILVLQKRIIYLLGWILLVFINLPLSISAQGFTYVIEDGNEVILPRYLQQEISLDKAKAKQVILKWYASNGYLNAHFENESDTKLALTKGCRFKFTELQIKGGDLDGRHFYDSDYYKDQYLQDAISEILGELENEGFLFAKVEISKIITNTEACEVSIWIDIEKGKQLVTQNILFVGAKSNTQNYLKQISGYRDSVLITTDFLEVLVSNLRDSELFEEIAAPEVFLEEGRAVIVIGVQERILNKFDGLLGYVPDRNGKGQIVGDFELSLWNVLNPGNGIDLEYQRLRPETSRLNIGFSQDWIGSIPIGVGFKFNLYQNDTTYQTRNISLDFYYRISRGLKLTGQVGQLSSTSSNSTPFIQEPDGKKRFGELGFNYSTLDNVEVPTSGVRLGISFGVTNKSVNKDSIGTFSQRYIHSEMTYFVPITSKNILVFSNQNYVLNADKITDSDLIWFGGANSFRGYSEEQFRASRLVWGDIEYRFLVNRSSYLFAFGALGNYYRPRLLTETDSTFRTSDFLYSTGFGISYKIRIGRLTFTYALSPEESVGNGKVHLGIVTRL